MGCHFLLQQKGGTRLFACPKNRLVINRCFVQVSGNRVP